jgi:methylenetetrahydrofolate--tRNA-(uracil-5-)-methyltransferase
MPEELIVIGGGLAGTEAAWQAAEAGLHVVLYEMRPRKMTPAHTTGNLAELICSNSLGSDLPDRAPGLLKNELRRMNSLLLRCAALASVGGRRAGRGPGALRPGSDGCHRGPSAHPAGA